ncbi:MAG: hypothetical protein KDN20_02510 [Verrucomicrobiae bacterium]|nr:hypothetical protein [Verrucomicrobiae bacterium]
MIPFSGPTCYDVRENDYLAGDETALNEAEKRGLSDSQLDDLLALMNAFTDRHLLKMKDDGAAFPVASPNTPSTKEKKLYFPDWTHRLDPAFPGD